MHDELARPLLEGNGGPLVKTTGDGVLATFDGPGRAIRFATSFRELVGSDRSSTTEGPNQLKGIDTAWQLFAVQTS